MEGKTTKMLAIVAVIGLCAVALIGAGYAAFAGTASTYNQGNDASVGYMTLSPDGAATTAGWDAITEDASEALNTYDYAVISGNPATATNYIAYYFKTAGTVVDDGGVANGYTVRELASKDFIVTNKSGESITAIDFKAKATDASTGDFKYFLKVAVDGGTAKYMLISTDEQTLANNAISFDANTLDATITVSICVGYTADIYIPTTMIGPAAAQDGSHTIAAKQLAGNVAPDVLDNVSFAFSVNEYVAPQNPQNP